MPCNQCCWWCYVILLLIETLLLCQGTFLCHHLPLSYQLCRSLFSRHCLIRHRCQLMMESCCDAWHSTLVSSTLSLHVSQCLDTTLHVRPFLAFIRRSALCYLAFFAVQLLCTKVLVILWYHFVQRCDVVNTVHLLNQNMLVFISRLVKAINLCSSTNWHSFCYITLHR